MIYIVQINKKSRNGDYVHVEGIRKNLDAEDLFVHTRSFLKVLYFILLNLNSNTKIILRESILQLPFIFLPNIILAYILKGCVLEINGSAVDEIRLKSRFFAGIIKFYQRKIFPHYHKIIVVSSGLKKRFVDLYGIDENKIIIVHNGSDVIDDNVNSERKLNSQIKITYVGKLTRWQSVLKSIDKLNNISLSKKNIRMVLAGDDEFLRIDTKIWPNLDFDLYSKVKHTEAIGLYKKTDYILIADNRLYNNSLLSSPIKLFEGLNLGCVPIFYKKNNILSELEGVAEKLPEYFLEDDVSLSIDDLVEGALTSFKYSRTWADVVHELRVVANVQ